MSASSSSLKASKWRQPQADSYIYGYMVPEAFLVKEGRRVLRQGLEMLNTPRNLRQDDESTVHLHLKPKVSKMFKSISRLYPTQVPSELVIALGAWHIMTRAGLLGIFEFFTDRHGVHPSPRLKDDFLLHPSVVDVHDAVFKLNLHDRCAKLTRVHTRGCDDQLGVKSVEYAIALASNDPSDKLIWGESLDEIALSISPIVDSLQDALDTKQPPVLLPVVKDYRPVFETPRALPSPRARMKQEDATMLDVRRGRVKEIQWKSTWKESMY